VPNFKWFPEKAWLSRVWFVEWYMWVGKLGFCKGLTDLIALFTLLSYPLRQISN
jgi:hypothetical protein